MKTVQSDTITLTSGQRIGYTIYFNSDHSALSGFAGAVLATNQNPPWVYGMIRGWDYTNVIIGLHNAAPDSQSVKCIVLVFYNE